MSYAKANWALVPEHVRGGLQRYIEKGVLPGDCMRAVLANDLRDAFNRADPEVREAMGNIVHFLVAYAPRECWGDRNKLTFWWSEGGLEGRAAKAERHHLQLVADNG